MSPSLAMLRSFRSFLNSSTVTVSSVQLQYRQKPLLGTCHTSLCAQIYCNYIWVQIYGNKMGMYCPLGTNILQQDGYVLRSGTEIPSNGQNHTVIADVSLVGKPLHRDEIYSVAVRYTKW